MPFGVYDRENGVVALPLTGSAACPVFGSPGLGLCGHLAVQVR
jgi:hypothetical protein